MRWLGVASMVALVACGAEPGSDGPEAAPQVVYDVWLDVDPAIGLPRSEVDDGLALLQALASPRLRIHGVSVVFGNSELADGVPIAKELIERFGAPDLEVFPGAAAAQEAAVTPAVAAMARALERRSMTVLALGPVTNVAALLRAYPELHGRIESIVTVAARRRGQSFRTGEGAGGPHRDFNFELDPEAMATLLASSVPLVFAPWEVSSQVWLRRGDLDELAVSGERGAWIAESCASWLELWQEEFGVDGFNPFDTLAVGYLTDPALIDAVEVGVWIEEGPDDRAPAESGVNKPYLLVGDPGIRGRAATYLFRPHPEFKDRLLASLKGP